MRCGWLALLAAVCAVGAMATIAEAYTPADLYMHRPFDETTGDVFAESGSNGLDTIFRRPLKCQEFPESDFSEAGQSFLGSMFGNGGVGMGVRILADGPNHQVIDKAPSNAGALASQDDSRWCGSQRFHPRRHAMGE